MSVPVKSEEDPILPSHARLHRVLALLPGLFRPVETKLRNSSTQVHLRGSFSNGNALAGYSGPQCSGQDLWVLQGLLGLATAGHDSSIDWQAVHERLEIASSFHRLALTMGHASAGQTKTNASLESSLQRLSAGLLSWSEGTEPAVKLPILEVLKSPSSGTAPVASSAPAIRARRRGFQVSLHPLLAEGVRAVGKDTHHLKLNLTEVRRLETQAARLLHHRFTQANVGSSVEYGRDTLEGYIAPAGSSRHQRRRLSDRLDVALAELQGLEWNVELMGELTVSGVPKYQITRVNGPLSKSLT